MKGSKRSKGFIIQRQVSPEFPPRVEYSLTDKGEKLLPILEKMEEFGNLYSDKS
ncbi:winged helix-turn-helix transcriptional regulator [Paenibacillus sp. FSL K6-1230]|uniref:winged helix-turn-helix transcriptional regulator n=1 Tax=Paenibacillus sp. FSL K6-1230 TaxID=2921603 RepID=UPI0030F90D3B